jgi:hypothetical protein
VSGQNSSAPIPGIEARDMARGNRFESTKSTSLIVLWEPEG